LYSNPQQEQIWQHRLRNFEADYPALVPHLRDLRRLLNSGRGAGGGGAGGSSANAGFAAAAFLSRLAREATERAAEAAAAPCLSSSHSPSAAVAAPLSPPPPPPPGARAPAAAASRLAPLFAFALKELLRRRDGAAAEAVLAAADRAGLRRDAAATRRAALAAALVRRRGGGEEEGRGAGSGERSGGSVPRRLAAAALRGDAAAAAAALADFAAAAAAAAAGPSSPRRRLPLTAFDRAFLAAERSVMAVIARTEAAVPSSSSSSSESGSGGGGGGGARAARLAAARARAAALVDVAADELDAAAAYADAAGSPLPPLRHTRASLTRYVIAAEASGMIWRGEELVRWVAGIQRGGGAGGEPLSPLPPRGAGAAPERPWPPPPAAVASAARAMARAGRFEEAAELLLELLAGDFAESVNERCVAAAVRFAARTPPQPPRSPASGKKSPPSPSSSLPLPLPRPRRPSAAAAHDLVARAHELGVEPATATFSALVRAELDAGSLPNALWVAEEAAAAAAARGASASSSPFSDAPSSPSLTPATWACLRARAVLRFGEAGGAAVDARRAQHEGGGKGEEEGETTSWLSLMSAAEATATMDRRYAGAEMASAAEVAKRQPNIGFDYDSEDDLWGELEGEEGNKDEDEKERETTEM